MVQVSYVTIAILGTSRNNPTYIKQILRINEKYYKQAETIIESDRVNEAMPPKLLYTTVVMLMNVLISNISRVYSLLWPPTHYRRYPGTPGADGSGAAQ